MPTGSSLRDLTMAHIERLRAAAGPAVLDFPIVVEAVIPIVSMDWATASRSPHVVAASRGEDTTSGKPTTVEASPRPTVAETDRSKAAPSTTAQAIDGRERGALTSSRPAAASMSPPRTPAPRLPPAPGVGRPASPAQADQALSPSVPGSDRISVSPSLLPGVPPSPIPLSGSPRPVPSAVADVPASPASGPTVPLASSPARAVAARGSWDAPAAGTSTESAAWLSPQTAPPPPRALDFIVTTARSAPEPAEVALADIELDDIDGVDDTEDVVDRFNVLPVSSEFAHASRVGAAAPPPMSNAVARSPAAPSPIVFVVPPFTERQATSSVATQSLKDAVRMPVGVSPPAGPVSPPTMTVRRPGLLSRARGWLNGGPADPEPELVSVVPSVSAMTLAAGQRMDPTPVEDADAKGRAVERAQPSKAVPPPEATSLAASPSRAQTGPWTPAAIAAGDRPLFGLLAFHLITHGEDPRYAERIRSLVEVLGPGGDRLAAYVCAQIVKTRGMDVEIVARVKRRLAKLSSWADALRSPITKRHDSDLIQIEVRRIGGPVARLAPVTPKLPGDGGGGVGGGVGAKGRKRPDTGPER